MARNGCVVSTPIHGREAVRLAEILGARVKVATASVCGLFEPRDERVTMLLDSEGMRVTLDLDHIARLVADRVGALTHRLIAADQPIMAVAALCALHTILKNYEGGT